MSLFVTCHSDKADAGRRNQRTRLFDHAQTGPQHRYQQRRLREPDARRRCYRGGVDRKFLDLRVTHGLVDQHVREPAKCGTKSRVLTACITHCRQEGRRERMVDYVRLHDHQNSSSGTGAPPRGVQEGVSATGGKTS